MTNENSRSCIDGKDREYFFIQEKIGGIGDMHLNIRVATLRRLEVLNIQNGRRLGLLYACEIDPESGLILNLTVRSGEGLFSAGARRDCCIPWDRVVRIGQDAVLVDCEAGGEEPEREPCIRL